MGETHLNYWIYGEKGIGKSVLARELCGKDGIIFDPSRSTLHGIRAIISKGGKRVVLDNVRENRALDRMKISQILDGIPIMKRLRGGNLKEIKIKPDVFVVVSECPPKNPVRAHSFHILHLVRGRIT